MNLLSELVTCLTKEELRHYKLLAKRYNTPAIRLDTKLVDMMRAGKAEYADDNYFSKLYPSATDKNPYYRLKNRVQEDISAALVHIHIRDSSHSEILQYLSLYHLMYGRMKYAMALHFLLRAEKTAMQTQHTELLDLIYTYIIQLSAHPDATEFVTLNPETYNEKQNQNLHILNLSRQMDQVVATLYHRLRVSLNYQRSDESIIELADKTIQEFAKEKSVQNNRELQIRIYRAMSLALLQIPNYPRLEKFTEECYTRFLNGGWFNRDTHDTKLQMLTYLTNSCLMQGKYEQALNYSSSLRTEMDAYQRLLYDKYLILYYTTRVFAFSKTNLNRALETLDEFEHLNKKEIKNSYYEQYILLNRVILLYTLEKFTPAIRSLTRLYINDHYQQSDDSYKLKVEIAETIIQYDSGDLVSCIHRIKQIEKKYGSLLSQKQYKGDNKKLKLIYEIAGLAHSKPTSKLQNQMRKWIALYPDSPEDSIIVFSQWLERRLEQASKT